MPITLVNDDFVLRLDNASYEARARVEAFEPFFEALSLDRYAFQRDAMRRALLFLASDNYANTSALATEHFNASDKLRAHFVSQPDYLGKFRLADRKAINLDLATGAGKSFVLYGIARAALAMGLVDKVLVLCPSLTIEEGEFFVLLGPNGAGKTTLISIIAGLNRADAGTVTVMGYDVVSQYREARSRLGVVPQTIGGADIYPALERGTLDAVEFSGPFDDEKLGFVRVAKYYYYPGFWEGNANVSFLANMDKWNALPASYKAIVEAACAEANALCVAKYDHGNPDALVRLVGNGAEMRAFPQEVMAAAYKEAFAMYAELAASNAQFKTFYDSFLPYWKKEQLWFRIAELPFDAFNAQNFQQVK